MATTEQQGMCEDHPFKPLIFKCEPCNKLICNRCKKADHEGHKTRDVAKVADEVRKQVKVEKADLQHCIQKLKIGLDEQDERQNEFDKSVKQTKNDLGNRAAILKKWVDTHLQKKLALVDRFALKEGRQEIDRVTENIKTLLADLEKQAAAFETVVKSDASDVEVAGLSTQFPSQGSASLKAVRDALSEIPGHKSHIFLPSTDFVKWKPCLRVYLGGPSVAETSKTSQKSGLAVALKLTCYTNPETRVLGLLVLGYGRVAVITTSDDPKQGCLKLYQEHGKLVHEEMVAVTTSCKLLISSGKLIAVCTNSGFKAELDSAAVSNFVSPTAAEAESAGKEAKHVDYSFKEDPTKHTPKTKTVSIFGKKEKQPKVYEVKNTGSIKRVFTVKADGPQAIICDNDGTHFAVIQSPPPKQSDAAETTSDPQAENSVFFDDTKLQTSVAVYKRPDSCSKDMTVVPIGDPVPLCKDKEEQNDPLAADACFYGFNLKQQVLVIADSANNALRQIGFTGKTCEALGPLMSECPLLDSPTALSTDCLGHLWVGCKGGKILTLLPKEDVTEGVYFQPRVVEAYDSSSYKNDSTDDHQAEKQQQPPSFSPRSPPPNPAPRDLPSSSTVSRPPDLTPHRPGTDLAVVPLPRPKPAPKPKPQKRMGTSTSSDTDSTSNSTSPGPVSSISTGTPPASPSWPIDKSSSAASSAHTPTQEEVKDSDNDLANMSVQQRAKRFEQAEVKSYK